MRPSLSCGLSSYIYCILQQEQCNLVTQGAKSQPLPSANAPYFALPLWEGLVRLTGFSMNWLPYRVSRGGEAGWLKNNEGKRAKMWRRGPKKSAKLAWLMVNGAAGPQNWGVTLLKNSFQAQKWMGAFVLSKKGLTNWHWFYRTRLWEHMNSNQWQCRDCNIWWHLYVDTFQWFSFSLMNTGKVFWCVRVYERPCLKSIAGYSILLFCFVLFFLYWNIYWLVPNFKQESFFFF